MDMLYGSNRMKEVFQEPSIVTFRRDKNLCDTLIHGKINAALKPTSMPEKGCKNCALLSRDVVRDTSNQLNF